MIVAWALLATFWTTPGLTANAAVPAATRATVWVRAGDRSTGAGWVVDRERRWIITARHIVGDRDVVDVLFLEFAAGRPVTDRRHYVSDRDGLKSRGTLVSARVVAQRDRSDLALLVAESIPVNVPTLRVAARDPAPGDRCRSVGHRHDADLLWTRTAGHVRQVGQLAEGYHWAGRRLGRGVVLAQSPVEAGDSGAALTNSAGEVVGVVSAISGRSPGVAIASDASEISALLADARGDKPAPPRPAETSRPDATALAKSTVWVRPQSTDGRFAGVLIDRDRRLVLTSASAVGRDEVVAVVAPVWERDRLTPEAERYRDLLGLSLSAHCLRAVVLARDASRDLALVELDSVPAALDAVTVASGEANVGDGVASMSHPVAEELMWLFAAGTVRATGRVPLDREMDDKVSKVDALLLQLPHQASSSGGPVVNARGELVGLLAAREGARQELAYSAAPSELRRFLADARGLYRPGTAGEWHRRGQFLVRRGRLESGIAALRSAVERAPKDSEIMADLSLALAESGSKDEAVRMAERSLSLGPRPKSLATLAECFFRLGDRDRASKVVSAALEKDPHNVPALVVRAELGGGEADVSLALTRDPGYAPAYRARARIQEARAVNGVRDAVTAWTRAIELDPAHVNSLRERARLHGIAREHKKAVSDWSRLVDLEPLIADYWVGLADAQFLAGDRAASAKSLASGSRVAPKRLPGLLAVVLRRGKELLDENPADPGRVADWYATAVGEFLPWSAPPMRTALKRALADAKAQTSESRRMEMLARCLAEWATGPADRPAK